MVFSPTSSRLNLIATKLIFLNTYMDGLNPDDPPRPGAVCSLAKPPNDGIPDWADNEPNVGAVEELKKDVWNVKTTYNFKSKNSLY